MKIAKFIKKAEGFVGNAALYELSEPHEGHKYVICSTAVICIVGVETYLFPATPEGKVKSWLELSGSRRGVDSHSIIFSGINYKIEKL